MGQHGASTVEKKLAEGLAALPSYSIVDPTENRKLYELFVPTAVDLAGPYLYFSYPAENPNLCVIGKTESFGVQEMVRHIGPFLD